MKQPLFHLLSKSAKYVQINCCNFAEFAHILQTCAVEFTLNDQIHNINEYYLSIIILNSVGIRFSIVDLL
ncbi:hypothetical protein BpHYR1_048364 [Brachionus plicatilis]|uniref:Uncharacterized protein n=1 Tax=Brachionus plicatilis TaxID=10195 RepID=A0A3M7PG09_BRAPC|nr:hypothetical protein BpHYR1_048364 [Brachionus plicatilis]